jgi:hypothetical protein
MDWMGSCIDNGTLVSGRERGDIGMSRFMNRRYRAVAQVSIPEPRPCTCVSDTSSITSDTVCPSDLETSRFRLEVLRVSSGFVRLLVTIPVNRREYQHRPGIRRSLR